MRYFPLFLDLVNKPVLVVGGGEVASRKVEALLKAGANVTIVSPTLVEFLSSLPMSTKSIGYSAFIQVTLSQNVLCKCGPPLITQS